MIFIFSVRWAHDGRTLKIINYKKIIDKMITNAFMDFSVFLGCFQVVTLLFIWFSLIYFYVKIEQNKHKKEINEIEKRKNNDNITINN